MQANNTAHCPRVLIVCNDHVDEKMAGSGLRAVEMARALSAHLDVCVAVPHEIRLTIPGIQFAAYDLDQPRSLAALANEKDVLVVSGFAVDKFPFLQTSAARIVVDLYDPFLLENLYYYTRDPLDIQQGLNRQAVDFTNRLARLGDYFICGSERQRDFWIGILAANGRINPQNFALDESFSALIGVVGIGFPTRAPQPRPFLRGIHPAFPAHSRIVLWGGGVWDWLDPLTLLDAWQKFSPQHPDARLIYLGTRHPNPSVPRHRKADELIRRTTESGLLDKTVFLFEWMSIEDREALLCEADLGVTLHGLHLETRFSVRTRIVDYFWAGLPVLVSEGDVMSEIVSQYQLGEVAPAGDIAAVSAALEHLLSIPRASYANRFVPLRELFTWDRQVDHLLQYCLHGQTAPDRTPRPRPGQPTFSSLDMQTARARQILRTQGPAALAARVWKKIIGKTK